MKCETPNTKYQVINGTRHYYRFPCGKCAQCRRVKQQHWKLRLLLEAQEHQNVSFVTFTYNDLHLPKEVTKDDAQRLIKRLRKLWYEKTGQKIRYYIVKEFGSRTGRQHFHAIIFGIPFTEQRVFENAWRKNKGTSFKPVYVSLGFIHSREFTAARAGYVVKYSTKFLESPGSSPGDGTNEFALCSRGSRKSGTKGLGLNGLSRIINSVRAAYGTCKEDIPISEYFDKYVGSMRIGSSRMSIDPYLKRCIYRQLIELEEQDLYKNVEMARDLCLFGTDYWDELMSTQRKKELRRARRRTRQIPITINESLAEQKQREEAKIVAERKQRATQKKIKL